MQVLIIKMSSLGDVVHMLPELSDARIAAPGIHFDWVVEGAFAEIPRWHPSVQRVIPCALRRWRRNPVHALRSGEWRHFREELRRTPYDLVLDAQGLLKSAWLAGCARGLCAGPGRDSARETLAAFFYQKKIRVPRHDQAHAVQRMRLLFARALGYVDPAGPPDFGLTREQFTVPSLPRPYAVLLHATTWPTKCWPENSWVELGAWLGAQGIRSVLPWGNEGERESAVRIAAACDGVVLPRMSLGELAGTLAHARFAVGVDTGLAHLAAAVGTPSVTLYGPTRPDLTGTIGENQLHLCSSDAAAIDRDRPTTVPVPQVQAALSPWLSGAPVPAAPR